MSILPASGKLRFQAQLFISTKFKLPPSMKPAILVMHGPNLNLLGQREPEIYGRTTLADINAGLQARAEAAGYAFEAVQSNAEAVLVERAQAAMADHTAFIIINPAAYTHTSVALRDALAAAGKPFIEVHLSNVHAREPFRRHSYFSDLAQGVICGLGAHGYSAALDFAIEYLQQKQAG
mgnify:FL=1|jgi:3-dehydroquinate dehydratase, type II